jgi:hypothetical protein
VLYATPASDATTLNALPSSDQTTWACSNVPALPVSIVLTLSLLALTAFISIPVWAEDSSAVPAGQGQLSVSTDNGLEGVWNVVMTIRDAAGNPLRSFRAMNMYIRGGQFEEFGVGTPPGQRGPGMGVWRREGGSRYSTVLEFFRFNVDGTFAGTQKVARTLELNAGEDSFTSSAKIQILDINGQLIQSAFATETATRFK